MNTILLENAGHQKAIKDRLERIGDAVEEAKKNKPVKDHFI